MKRREELTRQDKAGSLSSGGDVVDFHERRLPDEGVVGVGDTLVPDVNSGPGLSLSVLLTELVEDIGGVKTGVVTELAGNDLKGLGKGGDEELLLSGNGPGVLTKVSVER